MADETVHAEDEDAFHDEVACDCAEKGRERVG
jgi:hypothetical protein